MDILKEFKNVKKTNEALTKLGKKLCAEYIKSDKVIVVPGFSEEAVWIRIHLCGWDLTIMQPDRSDIISGVLNLTVSPDGPNKTLDIYNAALTIYPLLSEIQKIVSATTPIAEADKITVKKAKKTIASKTVSKTKKSKK